VAIKQAIDEVQIARYAAARADRKISREMCLRTRRKGRHFLVPDMNPFDLALTAKRIRQTIEAIADDAIDTLDAGRCEHFRKLIRDCSYHGTSFQLNSGSQSASGVHAGNLGG
jgi:hypothetical protein